MAKIMLGQNRQDSVKLFALRRAVHIAARLHGLKPYTREHLG